MPRKKIVFVIVEGPSDDEAIGLLLSKIFDDAQVFVHITWGDVTTQKDSTPANILVKIGNMINSYASSNHFSKKLFREVIHIVDTDGAYIPDNAVNYDCSAEHPRYSLTTIQTVNPKAIIQRNNIKNQCLDKMASAKTVCGISYHVYYMSCNLDHVLYDLMNPSDEEKESNSIRFARKYENNTQDFIQYISNSEFSVKGSYPQTWEYIRKELHSLERHTNLGICFETQKSEGSSYTIYALIVLVSPTAPDF